MKPIIVLLVLVFAVSANAYTVTNFVTATDTNWQTIVVPKLNNNYAALVAWNNDQDTNISRIATNSANIGLLFTNPPSVPFIQLRTFTVTNSTDPTFGRGAGIVTADTNYLYLSIGTNLWKRVAVTNW